MGSKDHGVEWLHVASTVIRSLPSRIKFYHDHGIPVIKAGGGGVVGGLAPSGQVGG